MIEEQKSLAEFDADKSKSDDFYVKSSSDTSSSSSSSSSSSDDENQTEAVLEMLWNDKSIRTKLDNEARGFLIHGIINNLIDVDSLPLISTSKPHLLDALI